ncbi:MAG: addiction module protein [Pyrinomonadaceae bacterium]
MSTIPLDQMTTPEKLRLMEELWADLSRNEPEFESPAWHARVLKEREERLMKGEEEPIDWEEAKKTLRSRLTFTLCPSRS